MRTGECLRNIGCGALQVRYLYGQQSRRLLFVRYIKAILHRSIRLISRGLAIPERFLFKRLSEPDLEKAFPVFIIGAPRTGSTFLYQSITNSLDVAYIDNLVELFYDSFCAGFFISKALYGNKPHNNFVSYHGNTRRLGGLHAPSECGAFWYRWLPLDDHYVRSQDIDGASKKEIRTNIKCALAIVKRPIIFKNLNAGQRLDLLNNVFPESRFIFIKRDPLATAQSIYNAKQRVNYRPDQWWSIKPKTGVSLKNWTMLIKS